MKNNKVHVFDVGLRALADFLVVQAGMLVALEAISLTTPHSDPNVAKLRAFYVGIFLPCSLVFPVIYLLIGLYRDASRASTMPAKLRTAFIAAFISSGSLLLATFVSSAGRLSWIAAIITSVVVIAATPGIRWLKYRAFESESRRNRRGLAPDSTTVLVVGGAGYIGSILVRKLLRRGYRVRVLDSLVYGDSAIAGVLKNKKLEFVKGDCRDIQDVVGVMAGVQAVVHLAAIVGDPACDRDHKTALEINYAATRMMIEIAKGEGVKRFVFASSCSVYGESDNLMDEHSNVRPLSLYAETKIDSEEALLAAGAPDFHPTILRFSTIFGLSPRPRFDLVINLLTAKAIKEGVVTIFNGEQWRPFLHVADAAESVVQVLEAPEHTISAQVYNVGDDRLNHTLTDIAEKIIKIFPGTRVENVENSDRRNYRVSFDKIREQVGFRCSKTVNDGILELKGAFEAGQISDYLSPVYSNVKYLQKYGSPQQTNQVGAQVMAALANKGHALTAVAHRA
jgi:nucleoside-diphosphate-sugar epimerase